MLAVYPSGDHHLFFRTDDEIAERQDRGQKLGDSVRFDVAFLVRNLLGDPMQDVVIGTDVEGEFEHQVASDPAYSLLQWRVRGLAAKGH